MKLLSVEDCAFGYKKQGTFSPIVSGVSLSVNKGDFLMLLGANGCGKSTIIKGIMGLSQTKGALSLHCDHNRIAYVPQESEIATDTPATALDIVSLALPHLWGKSKEKALESLDKVGLKEKALERYGHLSGGQKRRVLLARALMNDPELLIMDEPTAFADKASVAAIEKIVTQLCSSKQVGVVASTHSSAWAKEATLFDVEALHNG